MAAERSFNFRLTAPESVLIDGPISELRLPTPEGEIVVLAHHMPLVTPVSAGVLTVIAGGKADHYAVGGGMLTIVPDQVSVVAETAEHVDSIDEHRAHQALAEAQAALETHREEEEIAATQGLVERNLARVAAVRLRRK